MRKTTVKRTRERKAQESEDRAAQLRRAQLRRQRDQQRAIVRLTKEFARAVHRADAARIDMIEATALELGLRVLPRQELEQLNDDNARLRLEVQLHRDRIAEITRARPAVTD
jgi:plasmid maintenance system killer protein